VHDFDLEQFRQLYEHAFAPLAIVSESYRNLRPDLELASDELAGPMYSIREDGNCDYVFEDKWRFPGVSDAETFLRWCKSCVGEFRRLVDVVKPTSAEEHSDQAHLLQLADRMEELSALAYRMVKARSSGHVS